MTGVRPINHTAVVVATVRETSRAALEERLGRVRVEMAERIEHQEPQVVRKPNGRR